MKDLRIFNYNDKEIRTVVKDGEPWFIAKDVCDALGLSNVTKALRTLEKDELTLLKVRAGGENREMNFINESGLYNLIFRSYKPEAKKFRRWVTHEVLPAIRKHGMYFTNKTWKKFENDTEAFEKLFEKYKAECEKTQELQKTIEEEKSFTLLGHLVLAHVHAMTLKNAAEWNKPTQINGGINTITRFAVLRFN